ncbi:hypothetical protein D3C85_1010720 [compost metagenome]
MVEGAAQTPDVQAQNRTGRRRPLRLGRYRVRSTSPSLRDREESGSDPHIETARVGFWSETNFANRPKSDLACIARLRSNIEMDDESHVEELLIDYQPTERSVRAAYLSGFGFWKTAGWMALTFGGGLALIKVFSVDWSSLSSIVRWLVTHVLAGISFGLAMSMFCRLLLVPLLARNMFRKNRVLFGTSTLKADSEGLTLRTPNTSATFTWENLRGYRVLKDILVFQSGTARFAVPTLQASAKDLEALHRLLESHLPQYGRRAR